jgi:hypothetical protein
MANQYVLQRLVQRVTHMELTRDVGRGDYDREVLRRRSGIGREIALVTPILIDALFKIGGVVGFRQFMIRLCHTIVLRLQFAVIIEMLSRPDEKKKTTILNIRTMDAVPPDFAHKARTHRNPKDFVPV